MSDDDTVLLNLPGNEEPIDQLSACVAVDEKGHEGICSAIINGLNFPLITSKEQALPNMRKTAQQISKQAGKPVRLMRFTKTEVVETITAGMN